MKSNTRPTVLSEREAGLRSKGNSTGASVTRPSRIGMRSILKEFALPPDFNNKPIYHPLVSTVLARVAAALSQSSQIVMIAGPSGTGKTFLRRLIYDMILADLKAELEVDRAWIPVISFEAPATYEKNFMWTSWYNQALATLNTPLPVKEFMRTENVRGPQNRRLSASLNEAQMEKIFLEQVQVRGCSCMIVDEAQHLLDDRKAVDRNLKILKSLTNRTNMTVLLLGTYRQASLLSQLVELIRRTDTIDFPRYDVVRRKDDAPAFGQLLLNLAALSGFAGVNETVKANPRLLFKGSLGLIGMLKPWFARACNVARMHGRPVRVDDFETTMVSATRRDDLLEEIERGEELFRNSKDQEEAFEARLGIAAVPEGDSFFDKVYTEDAAPEEPKKKEPLTFVQTSAAATNSKPFKPLLYRRPLGEEVPGGDK